MSYDLLKNLIFKVSAVGKNATFDFQMEATFSVKTQVTNDMTSTL